MAEVKVFYDREGKNCMKSQAGPISRYRMIRAISQAAGAWKDKDHPELRRGAGRHLLKLRREAERRLASRRSAKK